MLPEGNYAYLAKSVCLSIGETKDAELFDDHDISTEREIAEYYVWKAKAGNELAAALLVTLAAEALERRRFDLTQNHLN